MSMVVVSFEKRDASTYRVTLDGRWVGAVKHKPGDGWRYHPRGSKPGEAFPTDLACMRSVAGVA